MFDICIYLRQIFIHLLNLFNSYSYNQKICNLDSTYWQNYSLTLLQKAYMSFLLNHNISITRVDNKKITMQQLYTHQRLKPITNYDDRHGKQATTAQAPTTQSQPSRLCRQQMTRSLRQRKARSNSLHQCWICELNHGTLRSNKNYT